MTPDEHNEIFKQGRRAGQEDVCKEILRYDPSFAWQIAKEFLDGASEQQATEK